MSKFIALYKYSPLDDLLTEERPKIMRKSAVFLHLWNLSGTRNWFIQVPIDSAGFRGMIIKDTSTLIKEKEVHFLDEMDELLSRNLSIRELSSLKLYSISEVELDDAFGYPVGLSRWIQEPTYHEYLRIQLEPITYQKEIFETRNLLYDEIVERDDLTALGRLHYICKEFYERELGASLHREEVRNQPITEMGDL